MSNKKLKIVIPETVQSAYPYVLSGLAIIIAISFFGIFFLQITYAGKILPGVKIGNIDVGKLTRDEAKQKVLEQFNKYDSLVIINDDQKEKIAFSDIDYQVDLANTIDKAWHVGRQGLLHEKIATKALAPFRDSIIFPIIKYNQVLLDNSIDNLTKLWDKPRRDIRYQVIEGEVNILTDTENGLIVDDKDLKNNILLKLSSLDFKPLNAKIISDKVVVDISKIDLSKNEAEEILASELILSYNYQRFNISISKIGKWIVSGYEEDRLVPKLDQQAIGIYVTDIANKINTTAQDVSIKVENEKVVDFIAPRSGRVLEEDETVKLITDSLLERIDGIEIAKEISLPVAVKNPVTDQTASDLGIVELIGTATTPFTGSPANRRWNIKNGTKFLSGTLIDPGEEFSTVQTLGTIDNTTGYLPELVIKGDETIPEFGGGLCQVSTTLFRSVLNAGLPVTARRNHSYRVSYYEKDAQGNFIGPGLDATIYSPYPDFKFINDTEKSILIIGYVKGDYITFDLYGTQDGRKAEIDGPHTISTIAAGEPIYIETDTLEAGKEKRIGIAHPGGTAVANYTVTYADGKVVEQEFTSSYRRWPAKYLIGVDPDKESETEEVSEDKLELLSE